jgi:hypothetical protein
MDCFSAITLVCGTLVVLVPTREGMVAAADSRAGNEYHNAHCDEHFKLVEINGEAVPRTVATVTGLSGMREPSSDTDLCRHLRQAPVWLDISGILKSYIEEQKRPAETLALSGIAARLEPAFAAIPEAGRTMLASLNAGKQISQLVVASYDSESSTSWVRTAIIYLSSDLRPSIVNESVDRLPLDHEMMFYRIGEQPYADRQMMEGRLASKFRSAQTYPFLTTRRPIRDITPEQATSAAIDFIEAISAQTLIVPAPTDIGGPVDVLFLGRGRQPERVRWKTVAP